MYELLPKQVQEFLTAAIKPYSYNLTKNLYFWFGILWGLPIPLFTFFLQMYYLDADGFRQGLEKGLQSPIQWFFLAHPLLFGVVFGIMGTIRFEKESDLNNKIEQLKDLTIHDPLTGLKNRRHFAHIFHDECARSLRKGESLTLLFLDIDHFKDINDNYGHHIGDVVLKELGAYIKEQCRTYDTAVRWGGEEFTILLPSTAEQEAAIIAERIRQGVESGCSTAITMQVTLSVGLAEYIQEDSLESITDRADKALYQAKQNGRNKVVCWSTIKDD